MASSTDKKIYWGRYLCKITDADGNTLKRANGRDAVYAKLTAALDDFTNVVNDDGETGQAVYIKMLVENYDIQQTTQISNFPEADITLTTAGSDDENHPYRGTEGTVCTISRTNSTNQLFNLNTAGATFQLENITLDGRKDKTAEQGNYRLIEAASGKLVVGGGTTMQYGYASPGGAINAQNNNNAIVINGVYDADAGKPTVRFLNCASTGNGGAVFAKYLKITNSSTVNGEYGTEFVNCNSNSGGAIYVSEMEAELNGVSFADCYCKNEGGALFHNKDNTTTSYTTVRNACLQIAVRYRTPPILTAALSVPEPRR